MGSDDAKLHVDPSWRSHYIVSSCVETSDNSLEGHVLGINFDDQHGFTDQFKSAVEDAKKARNSVPVIDHAPSEVAVIQSCLGACKITHLLRAAGLFIDSSALGLHDAQLKASVEQLLGGAAPETSFRQSACGSSSGGFRLRHAQDLALPCFIASRLDSRRAVADLVHHIFNDNLGDALMVQFDTEVRDAVDVFLNLNYDPRPE